MNFSPTRLVTVTPLLSATSTYPLQETYEDGPYTYAVVARFWPDGKVTRYTLGWHAADLEKDNWRDIVAHSVSVAKTDLDQMMEHKDLDTWLP